MERKEREIREDGSGYDCLFEPASGINESIKKQASLDDTIEMLPVKVKEYKYQAKQIAMALKNIDGKISDTCYNIWRFLTNHIAYKPDQKGKEQVRSVRRLWSDKLGDCDCFSFFTSCVLSVLRIPHTFRIASYDKVSGTFGHVYVVVPYNGKEITIDAVLPDFNREHPYVKIRDINMDLGFLDGIDQEPIAQNERMSYDGQDLLSCQLPKPNADGSLGSVQDIFSNTTEKIKDTTQNIKSDIHNATQNVKEDVKKTGKVMDQGVHAINRINPTTAALRLGLLAGMKLNLFGVAGQLRFAYLSDDEAQKRGVNQKRFDRYKKTRERFEKIFFNAGGKPENLKEAILSGKGNQDKAVTLSDYSLSGLEFTGNNSVREIVGENLYTDEIDTEPQLNGLGVVQTAAAVTAASGILATMAGILKNIGGLFEKGEPGADQGFDRIDEQAGKSTPSDEASTGNGSSERANKSADSGGTDGGNGQPDPKGTPPPKDSPPTDESWTDKVKSFVDKNKTQLIVAGVAVASLIGLWAYRKFSGKSKSKNEGQRAESVDGVTRGSRGEKTPAEKRRENRNKKILDELRLSRMK